MAGYYKLGKVHTTNAQLTWQQLGAPLCPHCLKIFDAASNSQTALKEVHATVNEMWKLLELVSFTQAQRNSITPWKGCRGGEGSFKADQAIAEWKDTPVIHSLIFNVV
ncbi:hypothetical protein N8I77_010084 [Diaporthe amygdali]|uniref:Uncharacterized protein n=1 Tax=Phomopsis amygdali TaxID=1214568 RepID=A0AAD9S7K4_PHOAM|nr:hypothetical protein N8I77_010084 [Diaporthe amygdali]